MAKIRDENRARTEKEKKIVLSGIIEGTKENERENEEDDWLKTCDLIKVIGIDNPTEIITKVYRRGKRTRGERQLVVELNNVENKYVLLKHSKNLKDNANYGNVYMNKDLTFNEFEEERALKRLKKERNEQLEQLDGSHRYGITEIGIEF